MKAMSELFWTHLYTHVLIAFAWADKKDQNISLLSYRPPNNPFQYLPHPPQCPTLQAKVIIFRNLPHSKAQIEQKKVNTNHSLHI